MTGATFGSSIFDGVDVFKLTTEEKGDLEDTNANNDGYWWNDMATGLKPHLEDLGVPEYSPRKGDCFYAVMGLPNSDDPSFPAEENEVKLVHSRRFGSEDIQEACSAIDILFASPSEDATGGYVHEFQHVMDEHEDLNPMPPMVTPFGPEGPPRPTIAPHPAYTHMPTFNAAMTPAASLIPTKLWVDGTPNDGTPNPTMAPDPTYNPTITAEPSPSTYSPTITTQPSPENGWAPDPTMAPVPPGRKAELGGPDIADTAAPVPTPYINTGPQTRFRALAEEKKGPPNIGSAPLHKGQSPQQQQQQQQKHQLARKQQRSLQTPVKTRSVRLLLAGHIESPNKREGYLIDDLPLGQFDERKVYAFAQQIDVRLPSGDLEQTEANKDIMDLGDGEYDELEYALHHEGIEEDEFAQGLPEGWESNLPQDEFEKIVTSGVESRALLNDQLSASLATTYPVALVADPTSKKHYYVAMLASSDPDFNLASQNQYLNADPTVGEGASQRSWTDFEKPPDENDAEKGDNFGEWGRPNYGRDYRIVVKKMTIESGLDEAELTDVDKVLGSQSYEGKTISMRHTWMQEFEPDQGDDVRPSGLLFAPGGNADGTGDMLIMVGTTGGRGSAFGTTTVPSNSPLAEDLDGFVMKIHAGNGGFAGHNTYDTATNSFVQTYSKRIKSNPGQDEIVAGVCARPLRDVGKQDEMTHVYVVGSTSALLPAIPADVRSSEFLSVYSENAGSRPMEAFLMKMDLSTMKIVWTVQVGAFIPGGNSKGNAFGFGCAVTRDGEDVYLSGLVKKDGVATDFSDQDFQGVDWNAEGGTDVFVSSYRTADGSRNFLKQIGSTRDDFPSRNNGGITTDRFGNAIITGNTRGSLMRERSGDEYRYGAAGSDAASDVFIMSLERATSNHLPVMHDGLDVRVPMPEVVHVPAKDLPVPAPVPQPLPVPAPEVVSVPAAISGDIETNNGAIVGVVAICLGFILIAASAYALVVHRLKAMKMKEREVLMNTNLHDGQRGGSSNLQARRRSTWGLHRQSSAMDDFNNLNIMVEVRNSASGGWHGVYDDEQLQAIDFGVPSGSSGDKDDVVEQSLFMEDGLKEIEDSLDNYEIGDMDDVSDEDLIKAYNDAMALDIEPESPDEEFAMQGIGSAPILPDDERDIT